MTVNIIAIAVFLYSLISLADRFAAKGLSASTKTILICPILFMVYIVNIKAVVDLILLKIWVGSFITLVSYFFRSSNHFVISLNIITYFTMMVLILFHNLKITETRSAR